MVPPSTSLLITVETPLRMLEREKSLYCPENFERNKSSYSPPSKLLFCLPSLVRDRETLQSACFTFRCVLPGRGEGGPVSPGTYMHSIHQPLKEPVEE